MEFSKNGDLNGLVTWEDSDNLIRKWFCHNGEIDLWRKINFLNEAAKKNQIYRLGYNLLSFVDECKP